MGCYGIGVSRVLATVVEVGFKDGCLNWPQLVAPYLFCIVSSCKVCNISNDNTICCIALKLCDTNAWYIKQNIDTL